MVSFLGLLSEPFFAFCSSTNSMQFTDWNFELNIKILVKIAGKRSYCFFSVKFFELKMIELTKFFPVKRICFILLSHADVCRGLIHCSLNSSLFCSSCSFASDWFISYCILFSLEKLNEEATSSTLFCIISLSKVSSHLRFRYWILAIEIHDCHCFS